MSKRLRSLLAVFSALLLAACAATQAPREFPEMSESSAEPALVIAKRIEGAYFPKSTACDNLEEKSAILVSCFDPPPSWFRAKTIATVAGKPVPDEFFASTTSHWGMGKFEPDPPAELIYLWKQGDSYLMPRYQRRALVESKAGEYYLVIDSAHTTSFLPCGVNELREPIVRDNFKESLEILNENFNRNITGRDAELFVFTETAAYPSCAISMTRLQAYFKSHPHGIEDLKCSAGKANG